MPPSTAPGFRMTTVPDPRVPPGGATAAQRLSLTIPDYRLDLLSELGSSRDPRELALIDYVLSNACPPNISSAVSCSLRRTPFAAFEAPVFVATHEPDMTWPVSGRRYPTLPGVSLSMFPTLIAGTWLMARTRVSGPMEADADDVLRPSPVRSATSSRSGERKSRRRVTASSLPGAGDITGDTISDIDVFRAKSG